MSIPLAERIRPKKLEDYLSQKHLVGKDGTLKAQLDNNMLSSMIFWGPPGTGKTLLARALAYQIDAKFLKVVASSIVDKYIGESARVVREMFSYAKEN